MSRTAITLKFKIRWFPNEGRYWPGKLYTDLKLIPLMPNEDKNIGGSSVLNLRIWWRHVKTLYKMNYKREIENWKTKSLFQELFDFHFWDYSKVINNFMPYSFFSRCNDFPKLMYQWNFSTVYILKDAAWNGLNLTWYDEVRKIQLDDKITWVSNYYCKSIYHIKKLGFW